MSKHERYFIPSSVESQTLKKEEDQDITTTIKKKNPPSELQDGTWIQRKNRNTQRRSKLRLGKSSKPKYEFNPLYEIDLLSEVFSSHGTLSDEIIKNESIKLQISIENPLSICSIQGFKSKSGSKYSKKHCSSNEFQ